MVLMAYLSYMVAEVTNCTTKINQFVLHKFYFTNPTASSVHLLFCQEIFLVSWFVIYHVAEDLLCFDM